MPFTARLAPVAALLLAACAGWEASSTTYAAPPAETPAPSHHVPDAPPASEPDVPPEPEPPAQPPAEPTAPGERVAIASVQLLADCPDAAPGPVVNEQARASEMSEVRASSSRSPFGPPRADCEQSTVQLAIHSDNPGTFRIDAIRVLDASSKRKAGTTTLRGPTQWNVGSGTYGPWDERIAARTELQISYKLGDLDLSKADKLVGPSFNTFSGPFMLELDVSIDGKRRTIRSPEFGREPIAVIQT